VFARGEAAAQVSDRAWLQAMLDVEAALARARARTGELPAADAATIAAACRAERFDIASLGTQGASTGNPVLPVVRALRALLPERAANQVHRGATSQDILDTAAMLVTKRAFGPIAADAHGAANACAQLAERHRDTPMLGRTLLAQALPVTFGLKAAGWLAGIESARRNLLATAEWALASQLGGAVGTLAAFGENGVVVAAGLARELDLAEPALPWHTERGRVVSIASGLSLLAGALAKPARDVTLLAQGEVAEVREGSAGAGDGPAKARAGQREGDGGSSTMPHKRNPVAAVAVLACAARAPGLAASLHAAMVQEHERAAGGWQSEWETLSELLRLTGSAAASARAMLEDLEVDGERMRLNLQAAGDLVMAESVASALAERLGWWPAQELVRAAARRALATGGTLREALLAVPAATAALGDDGLDAALEPESYLGAAGALVDRALTEYRPAEHCPAA
jgi:3-carboxy-cis,cis-muconate cycloisomerase